MSLATLARKTKAKQRINTRGKFILNMTGRGHVLGMNAKMSRGNCSGLTKCAGKRAACCVGVGGESNCCRFPHGGKPAPQMGYGVYLNRKSKGAYHPGGGKQCPDISGCERAKTVWKQHSNLDASVVITNKKDNVLACNSDVYTSSTDCNDKCCCDCKNICGCNATDLVRYTRINKSFGCNVTKAIKQSRTASEQIARNKANVDCIKPKHRTIFINIDASSNISFNGCCGDQCLIQGQQYTFNIIDASSGTIPVTIQWCGGITNSFTAIGSNTTIVSFTVPKFNTSSNCTAPTHAEISTSTSSITLDYCKQAFKKPQMLGSCSGN